MPDLTRCVAVFLAGAAGVFFISSALGADDAKLTREEAQKLKNPIPYTAKSLAQGKEIYLANCTGCHGEDGKAQAAIIADATDLTSPNLYKHGTSEGEIFRSIRDGAGDQMPPFKYQLNGDQDMWNLVNYIRSLWPEAMRPKVQENK